MARTTSPLNHFTSPTILRRHVPMMAWSRFGTSMDNFLLLWREQSLDLAGDRSAVFYGLGFQCVEGVDLAANPNNIDAALGTHGNVRIALGVRPIACEAGFKVPQYEPILAMLTRP